MIENLKPLYQKFEEAVKDKDYEEAQSNMCHLTVALAQEIVQAIPCNPLSAPVIAAAGELAKRLLESQLLMHAIITDDDAGYQHIPNLLYSVALIIMFAQELTEL